MFTSDPPLPLVEKSGFEGSELDVSGAVFDLVEGGLHGLS
jgi:hypothetical protein